MVPLKPYFRYSFSPPQTSNYAQRNIFINQPTNNNRKTAREGNVGKLWQDKGHLGNAPHKASQPAPFGKGSGARAVNTKTAQTQKTKSGRAKRIHSTFHLEPGVRVEMER